MHTHRPSHVLPREPFVEVSGYHAQKVNTFRMSDATMIKGKVVPEMCRFMFWAEVEPRNERQRGVAVFYLAMTREGVDHAPVRILWHIAAGVQPGSRTDLCRDQFTQCRSWNTSYLVLRLCSHLLWFVPLSKSTHMIPAVRVFDSFLELWVVSLGLLTPHPRCLLACLARREQCCFLRHPLERENVHGTQKRRRAQQTAWLRGDLRRGTWPGMHLVANLAQAKFEAIRSKLTYVGGDIAKTLSVERASAFSSVLQPTCLFLVSMFSPYQGLLGIPIRRLRWLILSYFVFNHGFGPHNPSLLSFCCITLPTGGVTEICSRVQR
ncbi:hypothetical protein DFH29DRAFT_305942 [Suillus ampliporus]|nr:hypothetical protein DFH29DRAFT_305942 [Suillus ampliporus]